MGTYMTSTHCTPHIRSKFVSILGHLRSRLCSTKSPVEFKVGKDEHTLI